MFCAYRRRGSLTTVLILIFAAANCDAFPTWIGVTGSVTRQTGGNPGTFTVLMNQYYTTLHASVGISVNGGNFKEYAMTYDGNAAKNSKWTYTPAAVFPASAAVKYYFRGWDDAGSNIFDGNSANAYAFVSTAPTVLPVPGDVEVFGGTISMGSWLDDLNRPLFYLSASDNGSTSLIRFRATRSANDWLWERGADAGGTSTASMMKLDAANRLTLFNPATVGNAVIVLDPSSTPPAILINGERVLTSTAAATSYLPLNPVQLVIGVNNTVGADALAVGSSVQATGHNATASGSSSIASGENSAAIGDHAEAQGFGQFVVGSYNIPQGSPGVADINDQLFVVGNGTDAAHRSNAVTVLRNGNVGIGTSAPTAKLQVEGDTNINGNLSVTGAMSIAPQGDLSMGEFTQGPTP